MDARSQQIHDMIQCFPLDATESPELTASRILDILAAINDRMDAIESASRVERFAGDNQTKTGETQ